MNDISLIEPTFTEASKRLGRPQVILSGQIVELVCFSKQHLGNSKYLEWLHDHDVIKTLNLPAYVARPISLEEVTEYCWHLMNSTNNLFLAVHDKRNNQFVGTIKAGHIDWYSCTADIGIMIGNKKSWGNGFATEAIRLLCRHLFSHVKLRRLTAGAMSINPAIINVFEKLGFVKEGIFRLHDRHGEEYCDHIHLGCFANEFEQLKKRT